MAEGAAPRVLTGDAHRAALEHHRPVGHGLAEGPVDFTVRVGSGARLKLLGQFGVGIEAIGPGVRCCGDAVEDVSGHRRVNGDERCRKTFAAGDRFVLHPLLFLRTGEVQRHLHHRLELGDRRVRFFLGDVFAAGEVAGVELAYRRAIVDHVVHEWLGVTGLIAFVVTVFAVTDHVDHNVALERVAVLEGELANAEACFGVIAVHVEDRGLNGLGHVGAIGRGTGRVGVGREADLVVDHDVDGAARLVAGEL